MRFGTFVTPQAPADENHAATSRTMVDRAVFAERQGFDGVFVGEHIASEEYAYYESLTLLTAMAARTDRVQLGTSIAVAPLYQPARLAARTATLDALSDGRFVAGFGAGYRPQEYAALGVPFDERVSRTVETVDLVERLWRESGVDHDGTHYQLDDVTVNPRPIQDDVPVWLGFNGERGIDYVVRSGRGWLAIAQVDDETWAARMERFDAALAEHGRSRDDVEMAAMIDASVAADREAAVEAIRDPIERKYREYARQENPPDPVSDVDPEEVSFELLEDLFVVGTPDDVVEEVERLRDDGFDYVLVRPPVLQPSEDAVRETLERFGRDVIPRFEDD